MNVKNTAQKLTRREVLKRCGAVTAMGVLAGCAQDQPNGDATKQQDDETSTDTSTGSTETDGGVSENSAETTQDKGSTQTTERPDSTSDMTLDSVTYPPGWSGDGIADFDLINETHYGLLHEGPSYTERYEGELVDDSADSTTSVTVINADPAASQAFLSFDTAEFHREAYFDDGTVLVYDVKEERVIDEAEREFSWITVKDGFSTVEEYEFEAVEVVTPSGRTAIKYAATGRYGNYDKYGGNLSVDLDGRILGWRVFARDEEGDRRRENTYELTDIGETTVEKPAWMGD